jgi:metallo-beta-lactamase family protein
MESLYGGIQHESREANTSQLLSIINETYANNGVVYIPSFALHRTQEILNILKIAYQNDSIPQDMKIYLDSPMAHKITNIYSNTPGEYSELFNKTNDHINTKENPFIFNSLKVINKSKQSKRIMSDKKCIIIAGSGMAEGGRIVNHLYSGLEDTRNQVVFVGYQAEGTLGNELVSGSKEVTIAGDKRKVKAKIHYLRGYSAHGDDHDLKTWFKSFNLSDLKKVFLIHGEIERLSSFKKEVEELGYSCEIPVMYQTFDL